VQYRVPRALSTWWQQAGHVGRSLNIKATAILLAEPCFFDDKKECLAAKSAEQAAQKHVMDVHWSQRWSSTPEIIMVLGEMFKCQLLLVPQ